MSVEIASERYCVQFSRQIFDRFATASGLSEKQSTTTSRGPSVATSSSMRFSEDGGMKVNTTLGFS